MKKVIPLAILALIIVPAYVVAARSDSPSGPKPSIVLVHGAWLMEIELEWSCGSSSRPRVHRFVPPNPLRGLASDSAYLASFLKTITGPIILVGHSYGGAVITNAATGNQNVKALVYVDAFAPDAGESLGALASIPSPPGQNGSCLGGDPTQVFNFVPIAGDVDCTSSPALFPSCFANDLKTDKAAVLASEERPLVLSVLGEKSGVPAWKTIPSGIWSESSI